MSEAASPQLEDGYTRIANELFDAILAFPFSARQMKVVMTLVRKTYGYNKKRDDISASQIGELCAMPRPHVSEVLGQLAAMNVVFKEPGRFGLLLEINKNHAAWQEIDEKKAPKEKMPRGESRHTSHYTYKITRIATGEFYLGVRSCSCHPNQDRYMGSGNWIATVKAAELVKEVIATYDTRELAEQAEKEIIREAVGNPLLRNTTLFASTDSVQGVQNLYRSTEAVQGVQKPYSTSTDSVQVASTESVHTKDNLPKDNQQKTKASAEIDPAFVEAWASYPKRDGGNSKSAALKAWDARVKAGVAPADMLAGVKRYAAYCAANAMTGTRFVKQAATFFGPDSHYAESYGAKTNDSGDWWVKAGFEKQWQAENAGCTETNAWLWREGRPTKKLAGVSIEPWEMA